MNFSDDPLGDISDGSDSFFDEPKPTAKRASLTKTPEKKVISDLFNIGGMSRESKEISKKTDDWLGLENSKESILDIKKSPVRAPKVTKKISFDDDDDLLGNLGLSKRPPSRSGEENKPQVSGKKLDLLESIIGPTKTEERKTTFDDILKESKANKLQADTKQNPTTSILGDISTTGRDGRRGRRPSTGLVDPLGLFTSENENKSSIKQDGEDISHDKKFASRGSEFSKPTQSQSTPNIHDQQGLPDWLGGSKIKISKSENILHKAVELEPKPEEITMEVAKEKPKEPEKELVSHFSNENETLKSILNQQKLAQSNMEYQNTSLALQQQESQLLMALQLKKYEENLFQMQQKQQDVLIQQEKQFNTLLERQFSKQQIMENNMRLQQERINNHIQMLISQPLITQHSPEQDELNELKKTASEESIKIYENIINQLKQRQHEEIFLLEESYKKQISLLEQSLQSTEEHLKRDINKSEEAFQERMISINRQHDEEINKYKQKIQEIQSQHDEQLKQIRENHVKVIDEIKFEHATILENIKQAKQSETTLFSESNLYAQKLDSNIEMLYINSKSLQDLRMRVENDYSVLSKAREESLKAKEEEIILMKATLEKCRESAEKERAELLGLVRTLETKIAEQNQNAREERWAFQQAASTLAARSAALDRELEFNRTTIEREREQLKTMRELILAEQEKMMLQLTEEKLVLAAEKSRLETSTKLNVSFDSQKAKAEMEAALKIAKEAAEMTDRERENLHREKCEVERLKRTLIDQERKLNLRENELESLMRDAEKKLSDGEKAISESKMTENKYNERLKSLQDQLVLLANREKKLAEDKIVLSKERLALNTLIRQNKKCRLCAIDPQRLDPSDFDLTPVNPYLPRMDNVDNDIIRLRLEATENEHNNSLSINSDENVPI